MCIGYEAEEAGQTSGRPDAETVETEYPAHLDRWRDEDDDYYTSSSEGMCCVLKLSLGTSLTTLMLCYPGLGLFSLKSGKETLAALKPENHETLLVNNLCQNQQLTFSVNKPYGWGATGWCT